MKIYLFITLYFFWLPAQGYPDQQFLLAKSQLETMQRTSEQTVLLPSRNMQLKLYSERSPCVAVVLHGLFQSPKDMQGLINYFYDSGCNVVAPLLAGHWSKDEHSFYKINFETWQQQVSDILIASRALGEKIVLVGHSTGGLLALDKIMNSPEHNISQAVLFAPAIKLQKSVILTSRVGAFFNLNQNIFSTNFLINQKNLSEYNLQQRPAIAGLHVQKLIENIFGRSQFERQQAYMKIKMVLHQ